MNLKNLMIIISLCLSWLVLQAQDDLSRVAVGKAELEKEKILATAINVKTTLRELQKKELEEVQDVLKKDFKYYPKRFEMAEDSLGQALFEQGDVLENLKAKGLSYWIEGEVLNEGGKQQIVLRARDVRNKIVLAEKKSLFPEGGEGRTMAHQFTDELYRAITAKRSIFNSQVIFVSDRDGSRRKVIKEVYMADFDGANVHRMTHHNGIVISPDLSFDGKKIVYSLISDKDLSKRNINLYLLDIPTGHSELLSSRPGINSGAMFMPDNQHIVLTLSDSGNAEIYLMNIKSKEQRQITKHYGIDVDPSIIADGTLLTFLSNRDGTANVYTLDPRGIEKDVKRISYVGKFNATPRFSPDGKEIVFVSWLDDVFDIFRINSDGTGLVRLTKNFGSNEEPFYSPDGQFVVFSSKRLTAGSPIVQNVYIMDRDGEILGPITKNYGNCTTPRWSK